MTRARPGCAAPNANNGVGSKYARVVRPRGVPQLGVDVEDQPAGQGRNTIMSPMPRGSEFRGYWLGMVNIPPENRIGGKYEAAA